MDCSAGCTITVAVELFQPIEETDFFILVLVYSFLTAASIVVFILATLNVSLFIVVAKIHEI